jgi:hypothetical protein
MTLVLIIMIETKTKIHSMGGTSSASNWYNDVVNKNDEGAHMDVSFYGRPFNVVKTNDLG